MGTKGVPTAEARRLMQKMGPEVVRRYEAGESYAAIARDLGVSKMAVKNCVQRNGGTMRPRGRYGSPGMVERAATVRRRYEDGERLSLIASDLGISFTTARLDLLTAGGQTRAKGGFAHTPLRGPDNPSWTGGKHINREGYALVWVSPDDAYASMAPRRTSYVMEHRLVMARALGRPLTRDETVHHINSDKTDNRIENLQLRSGSHGPGGHYRCLDCGSQNVSAAKL